jgi:hypothetical protein
MDSTASTPHTTPALAVPLNVSDQQNSALLDDTLALLGAGLPDQAGQQGRAEIERWETVLALGQLREMLSDADTTTHDVAEVLATLGAETAKIADEVGDDYGAPLTNLSKLLIRAGSSLSR